MARHFEKVWRKIEFSTRSRWKTCQNSEAKKWWLLLLQLQTHSFHNFYGHCRSRIRMFVRWSRAAGKAGAVGREVGGASPLTISRSKIIFFQVKSENIKIFTCEKHMRLECIYWTSHKWQKVESFFWICYFSSKLSYHSY